MRPYFQNCKLENLFGINISSRTIRTILIYHKLLPSSLQIKLFLLLLIFTMSTPLIEAYKTSYLVTSPCQDVSPLQYLVNFLLLALGVTYS